MWINRSLVGKCKRGFCVRLQNAVAQYAYPNALYLAHRSADPFRPFEDPTYFSSISLSSQVSSSPCFQNVCNTYTKADTLSACSRKKLDRCLTAANTIAGRSFLTQKTVFPMMSHPLNALDTSWNVPVSPGIDKPTLLWTHEWHHNNKSTSFPSLKETCRSADTYRSRRNDADGLFPGPGGDQMRADDMDLLDFAAAPRQCDPLVRTRSSLKSSTPSPPTIYPMRTYSKCHWIKPWKKSPIWEVVWHHLLVWSADGSVEHPNIFAVLFKNWTQTGNTEHCWADIFAVFL